MTFPEHIAKTLSAKTGLTAMLRAFLSGEGTGAPSSPRKPKRHRYLFLTALVPVCLLLLLGVVASSALAAGGCVSCRGWWHVTSNARPSNLHATGEASGSEYEIVVPTETYVWEEFEPTEETLEHQAGLRLSVNNNTVGEFLTEPVAKKYEEEGAPFIAATAANIQTALEGVIGAGDVSVKEESTSAELKFKVSVAAHEIGNKLEVFQFAVGVPEIKQLVVGKDEGTVVVVASNLGDADVTGETVPIEVADKLPAGFAAASIEAMYWDGQHTSSTPVTDCSLATVVCKFSGVLAPYTEIEMRIGVDIEEPAAKSGALNEAAASGGEGFACESITEVASSCTHAPVGVSGVAPGVAPVSILRPLTVSSAASPFGLEYYELDNENEGGSADTQAGSHPFQQTTAFALNETSDARATAIPKDLSFKWPPGLIGNPTAVARCTIKEFLAKPKPLCPLGSVVGVATSTINEPGVAGILVISEPLFNLEPEVGEPARLGFTPNGVPVFIDPSVRSGGDYGITVHAYNITQSVAFLSSEVTVWGVPGDARHDGARGYGCLGAGHGASFPGFSCSPLEEHSPPSFLALPTSCPRNPVTGQPEPLQTSVEGDSWLEPKPTGQQPLLATFSMPALDGCNRLPFTPSIRVTPDSEEASKPTGLKVDVHVPQEESVNAEGLSEADPRTITVALPAGVAIDPSGGDGLQACSEGLVGFKDSEELPSQPGTSTDVFTPTLPGSTDALAAGETEPFQPGINFCANASKIATVTIKTPILPNPIEGAAYLAAQESNPFGSLVAIYIVAEDPVSGVLVKLAGQVHLTESGQLVSTFENSPQAPFEDAELHFFGGERAPLASPARCGTYTTNASFTPWSAEPGAPPLASSSSFKITSGPNGQPCPGPSLPFAPTLTADTINNQAGEFSPLSTTIGREDGDQNLSAVQIHFPPGISGLLSHVPLCAEQQANEGTCPEASLIGETTVSAGVGNDPVAVTGGKVFITEKYHGAPFGISVVNPVKAGPYDLEHTANQHPTCDCVVVRGKIEINPATAALTVTTNSEGEGYSIPHIIEGIPVQIKKVNVTVTRHEFTFNPTNCSKFEVTSTISSFEGGAVNSSTPFRAANCANLAFSPKFEAFTQGNGKTKGNGASLTAKVTYPKVPQGTDADIRYVKVELPKALPSRLETLQKACTAAQFKKNPAGCPEASLIGHAVVHTQLLPVPLEGPVYFVSNGGEAFPNLVMDLQGDNVTVELVGDTFISKAGVTSTTFKTVPDEPFESFEIVLPEKRYSALGATTNLCKPVETKVVKKKVTVKRHGKKVKVTRKVSENVAAPLVMPNEFIGQNGAVMKENTAIQVTGCPKARKAVKKKKLTKGKKGAKKR